MGGKVFMTELHKDVMVHPLIHVFFSAYDQDDLVPMIPNIKKMKHFKPLSNWGLHESIR